MIDATHYNSLIDRKQTEPCYWDLILCSCRMAEWPTTLDLTLVDVQQSVVKKLTEKPLPSRLIISDVSSLLAVSTAPESRSLVKIILSAAVSTSSCASPWMLDVPAAWAPVVFKRSCSNSDAHYKHSKRSTRTRKEQEEDKEWKNSDIAVEMKQDKPPKCSAISSLSQCLRLDMHTYSS